MTTPRSRIVRLVGTLPTLAAMMFSAACSSSESAGPSTPTYQLELAGGTLSQTVSVAGAVASLPTVRVMSGSTPAAGIRVRFSVDTGTAPSTVVQSTELSDANGLVSIESWTAGTRTGTSTLRARILGQSTAIDFHATILPGPAVRTGFTADSLLVAPGALTDSIGVATLDEFDNVVEWLASAALTPYDPTIAAAEGSRIRGVARGRSVLVATGNGLTDTLWVSVGDRRYSEIRTHASGPSLSLGLSSTGAGYYQASLPNSPLTRFDSSFTIFTPLAIRGFYNQVFVFVRDETQLFARVSSTHMAFIDVASGSIVDSIEVPRFAPLGGLTPDSAALLLAEHSFTTAAISRIDLATNERQVYANSDAEGLIEGFTVHPSTPIAFLSRRNGTLSRFNYASGELGPSVDVGCSPRGVELTSSLEQLYVACFDGPLQLRDATTLALIRESTEASRAFDVKRSRDDRRIYVTRHDQSRVLVMTPDLEFVLERIVAIAPRYIAVRADGFIFNAEITGPLRRVIE